MRRTVGRLSRLARKSKLRKYVEADIDHLLNSMTDGLIRQAVGDVDAAGLEAAGTPAVLTGVTDGWAAQSRWTPDALLSDSRLRDSKFDVDGKKLTLEEYGKHCASSTVRRLPCIFEDLSDAGEPHHNAAALLDDYSVPIIFREADLFENEALWESDGEDPMGGGRMRYRWFLYGVAGSGSPMHSDPLGTSAWNSLLHGIKLWACFPPSAKKPGYGVDIPATASAWFGTALPRLREKADPEDRPLIIVQRLGETVYMPAEWWHTVINLKQTVAVTQNFANRANRAGVLRAAGTVLGAEAAAAWDRVL